MKLDKKDLIIIEYLKKDSSLTTQKISRQTRIPITTIHNRIKKLKKKEIIKNYTINIDYTKLGKPLSAYILITIDYNLPNNKKTNQLEIAKKIKSFEEVTSTSIMAGTTDIIIKTRSESMEELNDFILEKLRNIQGVDKTQTLMVLKEV